MVEAASCETTDPIESNDHGLPLAKRIVPRSHEDLRLALNLPPFLFKSIPPGLAKVRTGERRIIYFGSSASFASAMGVFLMEPLFLAPFGHLEDFHLAKRSGLHFTPFCPLPMCPPLRFFEELPFQRFIFPFHP